MVSARFPPEGGGAERQALELSKLLASRGHEVTVLARLPPQPDAAPGVRVIGSPAGSSGLADALGFMAAVFAHVLAAGGRYDAVHVHMASSPAVAAALAARLRGLPVTVTVAGGVGVGEFWTARAKALGRMKWAALAALKPALAVVNEDMLKELSAWGRGLKVACVPNGVDLEAFSPAPDEVRRRLRAELGWSGVVFLHAGRLDRDARQGEGLCAFLEGWALARKAGLNASFVIAGDGSERAAVEKRVAELDLGDSVVLMGKTRRIADCYKAADVFVLPCYRHGLSVALLEAMASGLPVLASTEPGVAGPAGPGRGGLLFELERPGQIRERLLELASDPVRRAGLGSQARLAVGPYSIENTARGYLKLYGAKESV